MQLNSGTVLQMTSFLHLHSQERLGRWAARRFFSKVVLGRYLTTNAIFPIIFQMVYQKICWKCPRQENSIYIFGFLPDAKLHFRWQLPNGFTRPRKASSFQ